VRKNIAIKSYLVFHKTTGFTALEMMAGTKNLEDFQGKEYYAEYARLSVGKVE